MNGITFPLNIIPVFDRESQRKRPWRATVWISIRPWVSICVSNFFVFKATQGNPAWFWAFDPIQTNWIIFISLPCFCKQDVFLWTAVGNFTLPASPFPMYFPSLQVLCWKRRWKWTSVEWEWPTTMEWSPNPLAAAHHQSPKSLPWTAPPSLTRWAQPQEPAAPVRVEKYWWFSLSA